MKRKDRPEMTDRQAVQPRLTQDELATMMGVSRARVSQLEIRAMMKIRTAIVREARAAGMSVRAWLFGDET